MTNDSPDRTPTRLPPVPEPSTPASVLLLLGALGDMDKWLLRARTDAATAVGGARRAVPGTDPGRRPPIRSCAFCMPDARSSAPATTSSARETISYADGSAGTGPLLLTLPPGWDVDGLRAAVAVLDGAYQDALLVRDALETARRDRVLSGRHLRQARALLADPDGRADDPAVHVHGILRLPHVPTGG